MSKSNEITVKPDMLANIIVCLVVGSTDMVMSCMICQKAKSLRKQRLTDILHEGMAHMIADHGMLDDVT